MADETIRTSMARVIQDESAPAGVRELALEILHWCLRDRFGTRERSDVRDDTTEL